MKWSTEEIQRGVENVESALTESVKKAVEVRSKPLTPVELRRCLGRLLIHKSFLENPDGDLLRELFKRFYPIDIVRNHIIDEIEYFGYSYEFRPIPELAIVPLYRGIFTLEADGTKVLQEFKELDPDFIVTRELEDGESDSLMKNY